MQGCSSEYVYHALLNTGDEERISLCLTPENLQKAAEFWTDEMVMEWFVRDKTKIFFYGPQIAVYKPGGIRVQAEDIERVGKL